MTQALPEDLHEETVKVAEDPSSVCTRAERIFTEKRGLREQLLKALLGRRQVSTKTFEVVGQMGGGFFDLNPAQVTVVASDDGYGGSDVKVRGVAKEGLIKQHAGRDTATRVAEILRVQQ